MADKKIQQVGLVLAYMDQSGLVVITRVRGALNEDGKPQDWKGETQIAVATKMWESEHSSIDALWREAGKEIHPEIIPILRTLYMKDELIEIMHTEDPNITVWGAVLESMVHINLVTLSLATSGGDLRLIRKHNVKDIVDLHNYTAESGVTDMRIAMLPWQKEALIQAFKVLI